MTTAATNYPRIGSQPVGNFFTPDTTQRHPLGSTIDYSDPYWGGGSAIYLAVPTTTAIKVGQAVVWDSTFTVASLPNTANLGQSVGFAVNAIPSTSGITYGWFAIRGSFPVWSTASVAANTAVGITAAGQLGANSAGKQILNARVQAPATTTVAKAATLTNGSTVFTVSKTDGWFVGVALSGTGIAASTTVTAIDPNNGTVTMSNAATSGGASTVTGTYNDSTNYWNVLVANNPFAQGAIT